MGHEMEIVLVPIEMAQNSIEARKIVLRQLIDNEVDSPHVGGVFSGEMTTHAGIGDIVLPYHNKEMRKVARAGIRKLKDIKDAVNKEGYAATLVKDIKKFVPEFAGIDEGDLLDLLNLEMIGIETDVTLHSEKGELVFTFVESSQREEYWEQYWKERGGRNEYMRLGYGDDAILVNDLLWDNLIESRARGDLKVRNLDGRKGGDITGRNVIGKKWAVVVDMVD